MAKVAEVGPEVKNEITKSSIESVNASNAPAKTPGMAKGKTTKRRESKALAYKSQEASSKAGSKLANLERTTMATKAI